MFSSIGFIILAFATGTAQSLGRQHRPIALALWWVLVANYVVTRNIPDAMTSVLAASYPAAIAAAAIAALNSRMRPYLLPLFISFASIAGGAVLGKDRAEDLGQAMAILWVAGAAIGAAAFWGSDAPATTRTVLILLLAGLLCEAVGWITWGHGAPVGYRFAHVVTRLTLLMIVVVQAAELLRVTWRPPWATIAGLKLERVREWARTWRRAEIDDGRNGTQAPSSRT